MIQPELVFFHGERVSALLDFFSCNPPPLPRDGKRIANTTGWPHFLWSLGLKPATRGLGGEASFKINKLGTLDPVRASERLAPLNAADEKSLLLIPALRVQFCFGIPGDLLIHLQAQFDFQKAFHSKNGDLRMEVRAIA